MIAVAGAERMAGRPDEARGAARDGQSREPSREQQRPLPGNGTAGAPADAPVSVDAVRAALEVSRLTVTRMASELGIPRATLEAYRLGTRRMPPATRLRLARYLSDHASVLRRLSEILEGR